MEYTFELENVGIVQKLSLTIPIGKIALIAGHNGEGKTTIALAAGAALAARRMPLDEDLSEVSEYISDGAASGTVMMTTPKDKGLRITWKRPKTAEMDGLHESIGLSAAGLQHFLSMSVKDRAEYLTKVLKADVTIDDFTQALDDAGLDGARITKDLWREIKVLGFDAVLKQQNAEGIVLKRKWQEATGKRTWSSKAGLEWCPDDWSEELHDVTTEELENVVQSARQLVESAIRTDAVFNANIEELEALKKSVPNIEQELEKVKTDLSIQEQNLSTAVALRDALPSGKIDATLECPECHTPLTLAFGALTRTASVTEEERNVRTEAVQQQSAKCAAIAQEISKLRTEVSRLKALLMRGEDAARKLHKLQIERDQMTQTGTDLPAARLALEVAEQRLKSKTVMQFAHTTNNRIIENAVIQKLLEPEGLRRQKLITKLEWFSETFLLPICSDARLADRKWQDVEILPDLSVSYGGRKYHGRVSGGHRFRARATLQIAFAWLEKSKIVVIDEADILDPRGSGGLIRAIQKAELSAIVCMKQSSPAGLPDLAMLGKGETYWIESGVLKSLRQAAAVPA